MNEKEAKRLLVARTHRLAHENGSPMDVMNEMSDEDIEHILNVYGDDDADQARFHYKAEHEAYLRKQYDGGGGKTSRMLRGATQIALFVFCCLVFPLGLTYVVKKEYAGLAAIVGVVGGLISSVFAMRSLYDWWPCEGDKARTKHREWQAKGEYSAVTDYTPWWKGLLSWLLGMALMAALALLAVRLWAWFEAYAARH